MLKNPFPQRAGGASFMRCGWRSLAKSENPAKSMGLPASGGKIGPLIHNIYFGHWQTPVARSNEAKAGRPRSIA
jgi:hypothetical protein